MAHAFLTQVKSIDVYSSRSFGFPQGNRGEGVGRAARWDLLIQIIRHSEKGLMKPESEEEDLAAPAPAQQPQD
jgi:hypothetical protein